VVFGGEGAPQAKHFDPEKLEILLAFRRANLYHFA
jgi:hypothetical protein